MLSISIPPRVITFLGSIPITNGVIAAFTTSFILIVFALIVRRNLGIVPSRLQAAVEQMIEYFDIQLTSAFGSKKEARRFLPLIVTLILFIGLANQLSLLPLLFQITYEGQPLMRLSTSDLNQTLSLALVVLGLAHVLAFAFSPLKHLGNFIKIAPLIQARSLRDVGFAFLDLFMGLLDIIGELAKILSLSARLFGNIFAGDVMILVIVSLSTYTQFFVPLPFLALSIFSGFVQAFVFALLSIQFLSGTITSVKGKGHPVPIEGTSG